MSLFSQQLFREQTQVCYAQKEYIFVCLYFHHSFYEFKKHKKCSMHKKNIPASLYYQEKFLECKNSSIYHKNSHFYSICNKNSFQHLLIKKLLFALHDFHQKNWQQQKNKNFNFASPVRLFIITSLKFTVKCQLACIVRTHQGPNSDISFSVLLKKVQKNLVFFSPLCTILAAAVILTVMNGQRVIVPLDCFSANGANYRSCAFTMQ